MKKCNFLPENLTFPQTLYTFPWKGLGLSDDLKATKKMRRVLAVSTVKQTVGFNNINFS